MNIPVVALSDFSGDPLKKVAFVRALGNAFEETGFVAVRDHGIPDDLIADLYTYVQAFFILPAEQKSSYEIPGLAGQRGYTSFGKEHAKGSTAPDLKEFFQFGQTVTDDDPIASEYPENIFVNEIAFFSPTFHAAYRAFEDSGRVLLKQLPVFHSFLPASQRNHEPRMPGKLFG